MNGSFKIAIIVFLNPHIYRAAQDSKKEIMNYF